MNPYDYQNSVPETDLCLAETTGKWLRYTVRFTTTHATRFIKNNTARGEYYQPRGIDIAPLAILVHGIGDPTTIPCQLLARTLVKRGIACFILYLVFHSSRMPATLKTRFPALTADEWFESYRLSVIDIRQIIDWASSRKEIKKEQIATFGISFGGFTSAITMGIDKRIKAGVFVVTAGNSEKITRLGKANTYRDKYRRTEAEYQDIQKSYAEYLVEVAKKGIENVAPPRQSFLTDPMTFANYLRQRPVFMINAMWDKYIPRETALDLWQACGKPTIKWFPAGHASIWLWYPIISRQITGFLQSTFAVPVKSG